MNSPAAAPVTSQRSMGGLLLCGAFLAALFAPTILQLSHVWELDENYTHGYFILPISLFLAWRVVQAHPIPEKGDVIQGAFTLCVGLAFQLAATVLRYPPIEFIAMMLVLRGTEVLLGGQQWANRLLFPTFFLAFMFPLPVDLTTRIAVSLQDIIASTSTEILGWFFDCFRRGNYIHIAGVADPLYVAVECSGVRQLMAFVALGTLVAYLGGAGIGRGIILVLMAAPVAILTNVVRVFLMALGVIYFGPSWLSKWLHEVPALLTLPLGILTYFGLLWVISPTPKLDKGAA
jgi:exosortase